MVKEAFLARYWERHNSLRFKVAAIPEEVSLELDFASVWGVAVFALRRPTKDIELARLRNIIVFRVNEMRWALADMQTSCSILSVGVESVDIIARAFECC